MMSLPSFQREVQGIFRVDLGGDRLPVWVMGRSESWWKIGAMRMPEPHSSHDA